MEIYASLEEFETNLYSNIAHLTWYLLSRYPWLWDAIREELDTGFGFFVRRANPWAETPWAGVPEADLASVWHIGAITGEALTQSALQLRAEASARVAQGSFSKTPPAQPAVESTTNAASERGATTPKPDSSGRKRQLGFGPTGSGAPMPVQPQTLEVLLSSFPRAVGAAVEAEKIRAERALIAGQNAPSHGNLEELAKGYIMRVFLAFARAICNLGSKGQFEFRHIESTCRQFLQMLAAEVYRRKVWHDRGALGKAMMTKSKSFTEKLEGLEKTPEWGQYQVEFSAVQDKLLADLDQQAKSEPFSEAGCDLGKSGPCEGFDWAQYLSAPPIARSRAGTSWGGGCT
jgi:hypothetical protein